MQAFVSGLLEQCSRHRVPAELIVVEWDPPADRPRLHQALNWPASEYCEVRILEVPEELHRTLRHWRVLPLYQMIAKNAGIRRARGEYILATNIDILFSDELFAFLAAREPRPGKMYRIDRWDVMADVPSGEPIEKQLAWCNSHLLRVNAREGTIRLNPDGSRMIEAEDIIPPESGLALGARWFPRELSGDEPFRWVDNDAELRISSPAESRRALVLDVEPGPGVEMGPLPLELRTAGGERVAAVVLKGRAMVSFPLPAGISQVVLHTQRGGIQTASDPRILNFRIFRCDMGIAMTGEVEMREPVARAMPARSWFSRARRALGVARDVLLSGAEIRIPLSTRGLKRLQLRQDGSGVTFRLGPLLRTGKPGPILSPGLGAMWEKGWYDIEVFRGETFRWMQPRGVLTLLLPRQSCSRISLLVEPGPAVGFEAARLEVRDARGELLVSSALDGRTTVTVPAGEPKGAVTLALQVSGGKPKILPRDPRTMALKLLRCETDAKSGESVAQPDLFQPVSGLEAWCVRGWESQAGADTYGVAANDGAELAVRTSDAQDHLLLGIEPCASDPVKIIIRDGGEGVLFRGTIQKRTAVAIRDLPRGVWSLLRFEIAGRALVSSIEWAAEGAPGGSASAWRKDSAVHLHTNACGDFTLMAREHWFDLRGYPELDAFSMNIDSLLCWAAHHGGARQEVLPDSIRIFHIEHATGSGWTPEGERSLYQRVLAKGLPWLEYPDVLAWARAMNRFDAPMIFNREDWGFGRETLKEIAPGAEHRSLLKNAAQ